MIVAIFRKDRGVEAQARAVVIDQLERERGELAGAPRLKFSRVEEMLHALGERKEREPPGGA